VIRIAVIVASALALTSAAAASTRASVTTHVFGAEVPPISSTRGTFMGGSQGPVGAWRISIQHDELRTGPTVAITGGSLLIALRTGTALRSGVVGGSVSVVDPGARCTNQVYAVDVQLESGSFDGTLTHRRRSFFGRCVIYAATIGGSATLGG
jgi:hypothetical protein